MWCDRCGELDQASLGSDEHGLDCGYVVLCEACRQNIADAQEAEREQAAPPPSLAQRDAGLPLTRARGWWIISSRSFSRRLTTYEELAEAMAAFCSRAAEKLRGQNSVTGYLTIFLRTNLFNSKEPQYQRAASVRLPAATQDTRVIIGVANRLLKEVFRTGYHYQKCGVQLSHIQPAMLPEQMDLFDREAFTHTESEKLMTAVDQINRRFPKGIGIAAAGFRQDWQPKAERISKRYTTDWQELVVVKAN